MKIITLYTVWPSPAPLVLDVRKSTLPLLYEPLRVIEESSYNDEDDRVIPINWEFLHVALGSRQLSSLCCSPGQWVQFAGLKILVHPDFKEVQPKHSCWLSLETCRVREQAAEQPMLQPRPMGPATCWCCPLD